MPPRQFSPCNAGAIHRSPCNAGAIHRRHRWSLSARSAMGVAPWSSVRYLAANLKETALGMVSLGPSLEFNLNAVAYLSDVLIDVNLVFRFVPSPLTTAMIVTEIPAAIRPYSMAVAPDSSFTKRANRFFIESPL